MPPAAPRVSNLQRRTVTMLCFYFTFTFNLLSQEIIFNVHTPNKHDYSWLVSSLVGMFVGVLACQAHGWATSEEGLDPFINLLSGFVRVYGFLDPVPCCLEALAWMCKVVGPRV
ncbi:hypothetical protein N431DRAFT_181068 [Stipitochalara longipes BDJ]|nr:hypothetical protein N431DRAFT_181068 [Stipitochalara longipes BDJ]